MTPSWDTRQLVALLAVVDTGTFSAAALHLGYTQSAVSQQVASLERAVGPFSGPQLELLLSGSESVRHAGSCTTTRFASAL